MAEKCVIEGQKSMVVDRRALRAHAVVWDGVGDTGMMQGGMLGEGADRVMHVSGR